jgi:spore coat polysaccharide biosynthesis protein SpsF (cytidylyltransferase family)
MASTRLPGKVLADIEGKPLIYHVIRRAQAVKSLSEVVVATSDSPEDDRIARFCESQSVRCFRGNEHDVLDRYYQAAHHFGAEAVVRLTSDCPLLDPTVIDKVIACFREADLDYVTNCLDCTFPDGLDTEVFRTEALDRAWREATLASEREHVTPYIRQRVDIFRLANVQHKEDLSAMRWTVDEPNDLAFVRAIYRHIGSHTFGMDEVLEVLRTHPDLHKLNAGITRNEGYAKSLRQDATVRQGDAA